MGGNSNEFSRAEFNFAIDPRAADFVLHILRCPVLLLPMETCKAVSRALNWQSSKELNFMRLLCPSLAEWPGFIFDQVAATVVLDRTSVRLFKDIRGSVEMKNKQYEGNLVKSNEESNVKLLLKVCSNAVSKLIHKGLKCEEDPVLTFYFMKDTKPFEIGIEMSRSCKNGTPLL